MSRNPYILTEVTKDVCKDFNKANCKMKAKHCYILMQLHIHVAIFQPEDSAEAGDGAQRDSTV